MNKKYLMIIILVVGIIAGIVIFEISNNIKSKNEDVKGSNMDSVSKNYEEYVLENNVEYPKELKSLDEIPTPSSIVFYYEGKSYAFNYGTDEFNEILRLNKLRDKGNIGATKGMIFVDDVKSNGILLEYSYKNYEPVYFELVSDEKLSNTKINSVSVGYSKDVFKQLVYIGLESSNELLEYLYSKI